MQTLNLSIDCLDRPGLLAEIAQIIAGYGHNIKVCSLPMHLLKRTRYDLSALLR